MLWTIWKQGISLDIAGYGQQDCHEWLVAVSDDACFQMNLRNTHAD